LDIRDKGCLFPGCSCTRYVDSHHLKHWADGGETSLENLATLCKFHHRALHQGEFTIARSPDEVEEFQFADRCGNKITPTFRPQLPCHDDVSAEILHIENFRPEIDSNTCKTRWGGESMDYHMAIQSLLEREYRAEKNVSAESLFTEASVEEIDEGRLILQ
ncbi:MAG: HNH endonuclease signature motif containing protein, partial [Gammaproteobacteria bacterium]|nr:HNH endonuclease signature motif containing protein [Gammaproteobacteria bacterium]